MNMQMHHLITDCMVHFKRIKPNEKVKIKSEVKVGKPLHLCTASEVLV